MTEKHCQNCKQDIGNFEESYSYYGQVICKACMIKLEKQFQDSETTNGNIETEISITEVQIEQDQDMKCQTPAVGERATADLKKDAEHFEDKASSGEDGIPEANIIECEKCGTANRIKPHSARLRPICGQCGNSLLYSRRPSASILILWNSVLLIALAGVVCGMVFTPVLLSKDFSELKAIEDSKTRELRKNEERKLVELESRLKVELEQINPAQLHDEAATYYGAILDARESYDKRYALTPREKAQLRMREFASDSAKSYRESIKAVALEASPKGSDIDVVESLQGMTLRIDFDMSSMTSGEHGTRTKHNTKDTLKKEVITLISRVTNDVFQFCKDLDLQAIYVGCRHYVSTHYEDGSTRDENTILYKIRIRKKQMPELLNNPFLDVYSTTQYFEIEEDNFEDIEIVFER